MNEEPKKWKKGDIGPDGRVFWSYGKKYRNSERWMTLEQYTKEHKRHMDNNRRWREKNVQKLKEQKQRHYLRHSEDHKARLYGWREKNPDRFKEQRRRQYLKKSLSNYNGVSYEAWLQSLPKPHCTLAAIDALTPAPGQTLAELIHELSGYPMETCEMIANPPEPEKLDNPPEPPTLAGGPDLF